jgi:hypothetical protein
MSTHNDLKGQLRDLIADVQAEVREKLATLPPNSNSSRAVDWASYQKLKKLSEALSEAMEHFVS